ncbi:MAG: Y-family DNA polymerase [Rhodocyclaceae bacterium]
MLWIALRLPELPLQALVAPGQEPALLAVVDPRPRPHVVATTAAARALGVVAGLRPAGAQALVPELDLRMRDPLAEHGLLLRFADWAGGFSPSLSLDPPDCVLLEVSACLRLFGGLEVLTARLLDTAPPCNPAFTWAAAPTPLAARWLAAARPGSRVTARPGWWHSLDELAVDVLSDGGGVGMAAVALLRDVGVGCLGDIARLPAAGLARRDAAGVMAALARARGNVPDPRPWHHAPETFDVRQELDTAVEGIEPLLFVSRRLIAHLGSWLTARHAEVDRCRLCLEHPGLPATQLDIVMGEASRSEERIGLLVRERLAALQLSAAVSALSLHADMPVPQATCSADLFGDPGQRRSDGRLLLERLRARLGREAVTSLQPWPEHRPERAWRLLEPGERPPVRAGSRPAPRPVWLLPSPRALPPGLRLTLLRGPERIEAGWWDGQDICRDYYVARDPQQALCWVFRTPDEPDRWYMHGYFG